MRYVIHGCIETDGTVERVPDTAATFWTVYEVVTVEGDHVEEHAVIDLPSYGEAIAYVLAHNAMPPERMTHDELRRAVQYAPDRTDLVAELQRRYGIR